MRKMLLPRWSGDEDVRERFRREAGAMASWSIRPSCRCMKWVKRTGCRGFR